MKTKKIIYYVVTALFSLIMLASAANILFKLPEAQAMFQTLGFPVWIPLPMAILKILGVLAIWVRKSKWLREWAYAGFFFNALLALGAHITAQDQEWAGAAVVLVLVVIARFLDPQVFYKRRSII